MVTLDGHSLTLEEVHRVAEHLESVELSTEAWQRVARAEDWVNSVVASGHTVYGINTGFGLFSTQTIAPAEIRTLNRNLILSHAVGSGPPLPLPIVRAALLIRANTLASGHSGVTQAALAALLEMLNRNITPEVPSQGSLGSSGDLAPLSHVALVLTTDSNDRPEESGWAWYNNQRMTGQAAMAAAGIGRIVLGAKEALALTNGATFSAALACATLTLARTLMLTAEVALSMTLEASLGASAAFDDRLHQLRRHAGQIQVAQRVRELTAGSQLLDRAGRVQDAYSMRCAPQVQGAARDALGFAESIIANEINATTDNPLLFGPLEALSGGNFHGEPVGMVMDFLKIALSETAAISERRTFNLTDPRMNGDLPAMLVESNQAAGLNSGVMMPQYTAASLVLENQALAFPNSVQSLPTSGGKEDHNANAMTCSRTALQVAQNTAHVLAIELFCAARALDLRLRQLPDAKPGSGVLTAFEKIREQVAFEGSDTLWQPQIENIRELILNGGLEISHSKN